MYVKQLDSFVDHTKLQKDFEHLNDTVLFDPNSGQISITSIDGNNDWNCSVGKIHQLDKPEKFYRVLNRTLQGSEFERIVEAYPQYYRWRLMQLASRSNYSVHSDSNGDNKRNKRIHIPIITNDQAYLMFFNEPPQDNKSVNVTYHNLKVGNIYEINTTNYHTAVNHGNKPRWYIVGVRYEE